MSECAATTPSPRSRPPPGAPTRDLKRRHLPGGSWSFEAIGAEEAALGLESLGIELPMAEIDAYVRLPRPEEPSEEGPEP